MGGKYRLGRKIGSGSFGDIYLGECVSQEQTLIGAHLLHNTCLVMPILRWVLCGL